MKNLLGPTLRPLTGYDAVRVAVGILLLTAAGLKGYQLATEPLLGTGFLDSRWLLTMTVEFELLFGLWLLANIWPKLSWAAAMGLLQSVHVRFVLQGPLRLPHLWVLWPIAGEPLVDRDAGLGGHLLTFALATERRRRAFRYPPRSIAFAGCRRVGCLAFHRRSHGDCDWQVHRYHSLRSRRNRRRWQDCYLEARDVGWETISPLGLHQHWR